MSRIGEAVVARNLYNDFTMGDVPWDPDPDAYKYSLCLPFEGAVFDLLVELYERRLVAHDAIARRVADRSSHARGRAGRGLKEAFARGFARHENAFRLALAEARDYMGLLLARTWQMTPATNLSFSSVVATMLTADQLDTPLSYEAMDAAGTGLGAAGFMVYDDSACMVEVARDLSRFLYVESCGQCLPCKLGTGEITAALTRLSSGKGSEGDLERIEEWLPLVVDANRCYLPVEERRVVASFLLAFPEDFAAHLEGPCPRPRDIPVPKIVNLEAGQVTYDLKQAKKLPDWTYEDED